MKKTFLTFAVAAMALSFTSCKETTTTESDEVSTETTEEVAPVMEESPEVAETEEVDSSAVQTEEVEEQINEVSAQ